SVEHLTEVRAIRMKLEVMAALQTLDDHPSGVIAQLESLHGGLLEARNRGDVRKRMRCNALFHMALCRMNQKSYLKSMIQTLWAITGPSFGFHSEKGVPASFAERHPHDDIIAALKTQDAALLKSDLVRDLSSTGRQIIEALREK